MKYYNVAPMLLGDGSTIMAGNWGRLLAHPRRRHDGSYHREMALEECRIASFPNKPSRLTACFALGSINAVKAYRQLDTKILSSVYEIEPTKPDAPIHVGSWQIGALEDVRNHSLCSHYWEGRPVMFDQTRGVTVGTIVVPEDAFAEIVIGSHCRIIRRLNENDLI